MTESPDPAPFTVGQAVKDLHALTAFETGLRQRTEGITWAMWGLITAGIFLSYAFAGAVLGDDWPFWATQLWIPWIATGCALSLTIWRSAALSAPQATEEGPPGWVHVAAWTGVVMVLTTIIFFVPIGIIPPLGALLMLGGVGVLFGATNVLHYTPVGRRVSVLSGILMAAAALVGIFADADYVVATILGVVVGGGSFLLGGLYEALRG